MKENNKNLFFISFAVILGVCVALYFSRRVVAPFFIAFALAYLLDPLVDRLVSLKLSRTLSVLFLMLAFFLLALGSVVLLVPILSMQAENLAKNIPTYVGIFQEWIRPMLDMISGLDSAKVEEFLNEGLSRFGELPMKVLQFSSKFIWGSISNLFNIVLMVANMVIIPVAMFYLLRDFDSINKKLLGLVPTRFQEKTKDIIQEIDQILSRFVRGQLMVAGLIGRFIFMRHSDEPVAWNDGRAGQPGSLSGIDSGSGACCDHDLYSHSGLVAGAGCRGGLRIRPGHRRNGHHTTGGGR